MDTCFVIQPFNEKYNKRYQSIYKPAIIKAGLKPYRVDEDISSEILIESIEAQIRSAKLCFADISEDNPNVWYELGYAYAKEKKVVMVSSNERKVEFPFDIKHRHIIQYNTNDPDWGEQLKNKIKDKLKAYHKAVDKIINEHPETGLVRADAEQPCDEIDKKRPHKNIEYPAWNMAVNHFDSGVCEQQGNPILLGVTHHAVKLNELLCFLFEPFLKNLEEHDIKLYFSRFFYRFHEEDRNLLDPRDPSYIIISDESFGRIRAWMIKQGLLSIDSKFSSPKDENILFWSLTDKGKNHIADLLLKEENQSSPSSPAL